MTKGIAAIKVKLKTLSNDILLPGDFHERLAPAIMDYADLLFDLCKISSSNEGERKHISTGNGNAIGPFWAASCVREIFRTQRFCRGLYHAVKDCLDKDDSRPVHVVYAGTGPFAALALPVMMQFKPSELQFTFLEINPLSLEKLHELLKILDLKDYVKKMFLCDATRWTANGIKTDIVLSETMNSALRKEPQVAIMLNMTSQFPEETIFIPEEISVSLAVQQQDRSMAPVNLKELLRFNKEIYRKIIKRSVGKEWRFEEVIYRADPSLERQLLYNTDITVYKENKLGYKDSSLNLPEKVRTKVPEGEIFLKFNYRLGELPGMDVECVSSRIYRDGKLEGKTTSVSEITSCNFLDFG